MDLPLGLVGALEAGECVLFLGSGVGYNLTAPNGDHAPDGGQLAVMLAAKFGFDVGLEPDLAQAAQLVEQRHGRAKLVAFLEEALTDLEPDENLRWLASLTWKAIFTTNYDRGIERSYELTTDPTQQPVVIGANSEVKGWDPRFQVPVFHLHGSLFSDEAKGSILVTEQDYARFRDRRQMLFDHLRMSFATTPILYVGYSHRDANWRMISAELRAEFAPNKPPPSYRIAPNTPEIDAEILSAQDITTIDGNLEELRVAVQTRIGDIRVSPHNLDAMAARIPSDLRDLFADSPVAVSRLLNAWDYVNQADFGATPNTDAFHRGDRANWSLIGRGLNFQRDIEESLVEQLVEFATDPSPRVTSQIVLGSAGYGTSTLLMAVAAWFAQNKVGTTLFLRPGMTPSPADFEYAARYFPSPIVFCVDNAADYERELSEIGKLLAALKIPAFLLLGERLNEWRQCRPTLRPQEFTLEQLSDDEIVRLVDSLERTGSLGKLAPLDADLRFAAIKVRNKQDLLVTMREATEGKAFDAIIEDEFRGIQDERARYLYGLVCAFTRGRALARDMLCAEALGIGATDLYQVMAGGLEGILVWETIDEARGLEALRARHQIIADIVWNRCLGRNEHERTLLTVLDALNLTFGVDVKAFEAFTRDEVAVDSLQTLEAKTRFFELACRKDPTNGYVRQHYGRMLLREDKLELALSEVERALELEPKSRAITHTRGVILRDMALAATTPEV
ncbi:MAG: SIR2 family protein, partial [Actinomycetota bacterium]|nr:SIR2 family protein [Actinomycetota bacterium]